VEAEMAHIVWNFLLTAGAGIVGWWVISQTKEIKRIEILLNRTREEVARDYVAKAELDKSMERIMDSIDKIDKKLDDFLISKTK